MGSKSLQYRCSNGMCELYYRKWQWLEIGITSFSNILPRVLVKFVRSYIQLVTNLGSDNDVRAWKIG